jgi:ribosomal protein S18 acetylase RimI-like enzyme
VSSELRRALDFMRRVNEGRAGRVEPLPFGVALFTDDLPEVWDQNLVIADRWDGTAAELRDEVDRVQRDLAHRKLVVLDQDLGARLEPGFAALDWPFVNRYAVMALHREPDRPAEPGLAREISLAEFGEAKRGGLPEDGAGDVGDALVEHSRRTERAVDVRRFGAVVEGVTAGYCELRSDGRTAQVEDVATLERFRGRGIARAVVLAAVDAARAGGADLVFLTADTHDWPVELYRRLGFDEIGFEWNFGRPGS